MGERESNHDEKNYIFEKNFRRHPYQFIAFTFLLKPLHKIFFTTFTVGLKQKVKI